MRFHTSLTAYEMLFVPLPASVRWHRMDESGSRSRPRKFDMILEGSSNRGGQFGNIDYAAATWDEWGVVLGRLFAMDPTARVPQVYEGQYDYDYLTGERYEINPDEPLIMHARHRWLWQGYPNERECKCGAVKRWHGRPIGDQNPGATRTYPRITIGGQTIWACCESSIGPVCEHRVPRRPMIIPDRSAELHALRAAERAEERAAAAEADVLADHQYASGGAYARDLRANPVDIVGRIDELIEGE